MKNIEKIYVTMDWGGNPITTKGDGYILPRDAEMILNRKYYPTNKVGEWPCDPNTGEKLPIWNPNEKIIKPKKKEKNSFFIRFKQRLSFIFKP